MTIENEIQTTGFKILRQFVIVLRKFSIYETP